MQFYIHRNVLGTPKHFHVQDDSFSWVSQIPENAWQLGVPNSHMAIEDLLKLYGREISSFEQIPEFKFFQELGMKTHQVQWRSVLDKERYNHILETVINGARSSLEFSKGDPYLNTFLKTKSSLELLERAHIDKGLLNARILAAQGSQKSNLRSFIPEKDGFARRVTYNRFSTATGRLTVNTGPQILTLAKANRDIINSRWGDDGSIVYVDFTSLEPRVALLRLGIEPGEDIYEFVNKECFGGELTRARAKISTLGALYGMSVRTFSGKSGSSRSALKQIKNMFKINELSRELISEFDDVGKIMNMFGRQIIPNESAPHILVNAWLQSTAVDVALVGFHNLIKNAQFSTGAIPLFYIHDACVFDVPKNDIVKFKEIVSNGVTITGLGNFPITCDELTNEI
jgi:hypothetical protein